MGLLWALLSVAWAAPAGDRGLSGAERVLLPRTLGPQDKARQLRIPPVWPPGSAGADGGTVVSGGPRDFYLPTFDDSAWAPMSAVPPSQSSLSPTSLWVSPGPASTVQPPDAGLIFAEEPAGSKNGLLRGPKPVAPGPVDQGPFDAAVRDAGPSPPPACAGTLYIRRWFTLDPESLAGLLQGVLRLRYTDGIVVYLNGTEIARRRLPEAGIPQPGTLATERGPVEPERIDLPLSAGLLRPGPLPNLLALEVHPKAIDRCPRADVEITGSEGLRAVHGPYLERLHGGVMELSLRTNLPTHMQVHYGSGETARASDRVVAEDRNAAPQVLHRLSLSGLRAGKPYHYQVRLSTPAGLQAQGPVVPVHAPPGPSRPLRIVVYGDSRSGHSVHAQVVSSIVAEDPDLVLCTGDVVERGSEEGDWERYFAVVRPLSERYPVYMAAGNHEYVRRPLGAQRLFEVFARQFVEQPPAPFTAFEGGAAATRGEAKGGRGYYALDIAGVHLVALDSNQTKNPEQLRWLQDDLARAQAQRPRAILVWMHDGPYSMGWHGDNASLVRDYVPVLERYQVSVLFSGHDHNYERGRRGQLNYVVTGGGGAELRPLRCGVPGKKKCKYIPAAFFNEHHYVTVDVLPRALRLCAKRPDGSPLEPCQILKR